MKTHYRNWKKRSPRPWGVALVVLALSQAVALADQASFEADLKALSDRSGASRFIGTPGYYAAGDYIEQQLASTPNVRWRKQSYDVVVPVTQSATLRLGTGEVHRIYPFWPAQVRVNSTPPEGLEGKLVYCGRGEIGEIRPKDLLGNIAVLEASGRERWADLAHYGAAAILILGSDDVGHLDLSSHEVRIPIDMPRYYLPPGDLAEALRAGRITEPAKLHAQVNWRTVTATNYYAVVLSRPLERVAELPADARWAISRAAPIAPPGWAATTSPPMVMFSAAYDATSLVPDLAPGASQAAQVAAALQLMREAAANPADRPVGFFFSGADGMQFIGTRQMFLTLSDSPALWREQLTEERARLASVEREYARLVEVKAGLKSADAARRAGRDVGPPLLDMVRDRDLADRIVKIVETDIALRQDRLFRLRVKRKEQLTDEMRQQIREIELRQISLNRVKHAFRQKPSDLVQDDEIIADAQYYLERTAVRLVGAPDGSKEGLRQSLSRRIERLEERVTLYRWLAGLLNRDSDPGTRNNSARLIDLQVALDLSDVGLKVGPMMYGGWQRTSNLNQVQNFRDWFRKQEAAKGDTWWSAVKGAVETGAISQTRSPQSWMPVLVAVGSEPGQSWGVPAFTFMTMDDPRARRDTPADTLDRLNTSRIYAHLRVVATVMTQALNDPQFRGEQEFKWQTRDVRGMVVSPAQGRPVPDLPREGFMATYFPAAGGRAIPQVRPMPQVVGLRRTEMAPTNALGEYQFEGLSRLTAGNALQMVDIAVQVYRFDEFGRVTGSSDLGKQSGDIKWAVNLRNEQTSPLRSLVFDCEGFSLFGLYDPRFLQDLNEVIPLDARRNATPQRYNVLVNDRMMAGFIEPEGTVKLLFMYGRVGNRLMLVNLPEKLELSTVGIAGDLAKLATGFSTQQLARIGPLSLATVNDFWNLDRLRIQQYERAGVSSELLNQLHGQAGELRDRARLAYDQNNARHLVRDANGAWANEARVYSAVKDMANDVVRAAIFLLLLCIPFCFCMERLLIGTPNIYRQIAFTALFFAVMAAALFAFHPAFKISSSPLIIILAFAIIFMAITVISVVYGKFDTELKRIRSGRGSSTTTNFASASVLMSAVLLGIANMRKRKFRTMLTSITVVLITFAVLCFTSASRYLDTTSLPTGISSAYPGLQLRQRGFRPMPPVVVENLRAVLGDEQEFVQHWWVVNAADPRDQQHVTYTPSSALVDAAAAGGPMADAIRAAGASKTVAVTAVLGLTPGESKLTADGRQAPIREVIGPAFDRLERGENRVIYLADAIARELGATAGAKVTLGGVELEVAAVFDSAAFDQRVVTLSGESIAPLYYQTGALDAGGRRLADQTLESLDLDAEGTAAELASTYEHLSSTQYVIVPAEVARMLNGATLRGISMRVPEFADVETVGDDLARRFATAIFAGYEDGVKMIAASNLASVSGAGQVAIPLAIAGLIIFNTMMGSIAERRREIHVYTSLGLAPVHVGALFVAEALTYGLIGSVFGYVIGQLAGTILLHLDWLGGVTLNYSGTSAILTLTLILVIVLLSALVPARIASKIASPSIERSWRVPLPEGDQIVAQLPFTINQTAAEGALAYLAEYFDMHREGSIGKFSAGSVEAFTFVDEKGRKSRGLKTVIWLTPFDLGVRQHLMLMIHPGQFEEIYEVQLVLQRLSGDDGSWYRMNRTFLTEMRKQFLQWRSLSPQRMMDYVNESAQLFAQQAASVVSPANTEDARIG